MSCFWMYFQELGDEASLWSNGSYLFPWQKTTRNSRPTDSHGTSAWPLENFLPFVRDSSAQLWYCLLVHLVSNLGKESYKHLVSFKDSQALIHSLFDRKPDSAETAPKTTLCQPWTNLQTGPDFRTRTKRGKHQRFPWDESSKLCWDATEQQKRGLNGFQIKSACAKQDLRNMKSQQINSVHSNTQYVANVKGNEQKKGCTDQLFISSNISK